MNFVQYLFDHNLWSWTTFGPPDRRGPAGVIDHLKKEIKELEENPKDLMEWVDVIILACDGAYRAGHYPEDLAQALQDKQRINGEREWPDWRQAEPGKAIEHIRG